MARLDETLQQVVLERRARAEAATPGPWQHVDFHGSTGGGEVATFMGCGSVITMADAVLGGDIAAPSGDLYPRSGYSPKEDMAFIAAENPEYVLQQCSEDLNVIGLYEALRDDGKDRLGRMILDFALRSMARRYGVDTEVVDDHQGGAR